MDRTMRNNRFVIAAALLVIILLAGTAPAMMVNCAKSRSPNSATFSFTRHCTSRWTVGSLRKTGSKSLS